MTYPFLTPNLPQTRWAIRYLLFEIIFLPSMLTLLNSLLPLPLNIVWLNLIFYAINFLASCLLFRKFLAESLRQAARQLLPILGLAALGLVLQRLTLYLQSLLVFSLVPDFVNMNDASIGAMSQQAPLPYFLGAVILVPVAEELLFRGALFGGLHRFSPKAAWIISTLAFCFVHIQAYLTLYSWDALLLCALQYIPAGLILAWSYRRSGNILTPILIHVAVNALGMLSLR